MFLVGGIKHQAQWPEVDIHQNPLVGGKFTGITRMLSTSLGFSRQLVKAKIFLTLHTSSCNATFDF